MFAMTVFPEALTVAAILFPLFSTISAAGSLADVEHVVLFMQENRAFDHYFGTMAGVRGFSDPNVQINNGTTPVWEQAVDSSLTTSASYLLPWYLNYQGGDSLNATQCMLPGDNGWQDNHAALNGGLNNHWATNNTPYSWGHFQRSDIPVHFAFADGWTVGDMYQEGVIASTNPNRVTWASGSINVPGGPQNASEGGNPYIDNNETPGCDSGDFNCYPLSWKTAAEHYEDAGVSWMVFQNADNFDDNPLAHFTQFQQALPGSPLLTKGRIGQTIDAFREQAASGTLPAVSYIIGPSTLSEHPPFTPRDGAWFQQQIVNAVIQGKGYNKTALFISYDETGGWGDHVVPYHSPSGTAGEWLNDPYNEVGYTFSGPGFRVPFIIISPWTRNGNVFTEHADHNSQIMFVEEWLAAKGKNVTTNEMPSWRREHMSNLVNAFDFTNPDYSLPNLPIAKTPDISAGVYDGASLCEAQYPTPRPTVPYDDQIAPGNVSSLSEQGFKSMRGALTEGRYIVFEKSGYALTNAGTDLSATKSTSAHNDISQRWVVHHVTEGGDEFAISSAKDGLYIGPKNCLIGAGAGAQNYQVEFLAGQGYSLQDQNGKFLTISGEGKVQITGNATYFKAFSVTYST